MFYFGLGTVCLGMIQPNLSSPVTFLLTQCTHSSRRFYPVGNVPHCWFGCSGHPWFLLFSPPHPQIGQWVPLVGFLQNMALVSCFSLTPLPQIQDASSISCWSQYQSHLNELLASVTLPMASSPQSNLRGIYLNG